MKYFVDWSEYTGSHAEKFFKTTFWQGESLMVGLNCLEPGQIQKTHAHDGADKFYFVLEGTGHFTVGEEEQEAKSGTLVFAPSGVSHGVANKSAERLSVLVSIAPPFK